MFSSASSLSHASAGHVQASKESAEAEKSLQASAGEVVLCPPKWFGASYFKSFHKVAVRKFLGGLEIPQRQLGQFAISLQRLWVPVTGDTPWAH